MEAMTLRCLASSGLGGLLLALAGCAEPVHLEKDWQALGVEVSVDLHAGSESVALLTVEEIADAYRRAESLFDVADPASELHRLNAVAADAPFAIEDYDLYRCLKIGLEWARVSDGAFDPVRAPAETVRPWSEVVLYPEASAVRFRGPDVSLDLGGIALGYALDMGARSFARVGVEAAMLRAGPVVYAWGSPPGESAWEVPLVLPREGGRRLGVVRVRHRAVASWSAPLAAETETQSLSERIEHALEGSVPSDVVAAVALAGNAAEAQVASRALLAMGSRRAGALLERGQQLEAVLVVEGPEGTYVLASASLRGSLSLQPEIAERFGEVRYLLPPRELS